MTEILDEGAVSEIEAQVSDNEPLRAYLRQFAVDVPALCATVKHLRAENELWSMWHVKEPGPCGHHPCQQYDLRKITNNPDAAHGCAACEITALQSQLEQLRADVDKFSTLADERHDLLSAERRANDSLRQHVDESMRTNEKLTARNVELRQQLAQVEQERDALQKGLKEHCRCGQQGACRFCVIQREAKP